MQARLAVWGLLCAAAHKRPQTARHGRLFVCDLQAHAHPLLQVVLDTDPAVHAGAGPGGSRESAVRVAASLCQGWLEQGARVEVVLGGGVVPAASGSAQQRRVLDAFARLPDAGGLPLAELLAEPACRRFGPGRRVLVTTDLSLARVPAERLRQAAALLVVLRAAAFAGREETPAPAGGLPAQAWLWLEDPTAILAQLLQGGKEVGHDF